MKDLIKCLIEDLRGNLFGVIMLLLFGGFFVYDAFIDDSGSSYSDEDWTEYTEEQLVEDHLRELEEEEQEIEMNTLYYIDNGYYLHNDINCKGLDGYRNENLNRISIEDSYDYQELSPCNWCVKGNN